MKEMIIMTSLLREMKEEILQIIEKKPNVDFNYKFGILEMLETEKQAKQLLEWLKDNPTVKISQVLEKVLEITD